jgi:hypothetical protein
MRIGTLIAKERMGIDMTWQVEENEPIGIIIGLEMGCDCDGYDFISKASVRWDTGMVETIEMEGEDDNGSWTVVDVTPKHYCNLYLQDRAYGGPEEGGWWYDTLTPATEHDWNTQPPPHGHFQSPQLAEAAAERLQEWCNAENDMRRPISSMASEGFFVVGLESWPAEHYPKQRPHYC